MECRTVFKSGTNTEQEQIWKGFIGYPYSFGLGKRGWKIPDNLKVNRQYIPDIRHICEVISGGNWYGVVGKMQILH